MNRRFEYWLINQTFKRIQDSVSRPSFIIYYFSRKSIFCLVKLWSCGVRGIDSESLWHVLWFLHLLFFIVSSHVTFIVAASMQPFVVNLCWWILSSVLFSSLRPPLWSSLWRPLSVWDLGTIQEGSVGALCSPAPAQWVSGVVMGPWVILKSHKSLLLLLPMVLAKPE